MPRQVFVRLSYCGGSSDEVVIARRNTREPARLYPCQRPGSKRCDARVGQHRVRLSRRHGLGIFWHRRLDRSIMRLHACSRRLPLSLAVWMQKGSASAKPRRCITWCSSGRSIEPCSLVCATSAGPIYIVIDELTSGREDKFGRL